MDIQTTCRRYRPLVKSGRAFCQVYCDVITSCPDNCPNNYPVEYGEKVITTRFGKVIKVKVKVENE